MIRISLDKQIFSLNYFIIDPNNLQDTNFSKKLKSKILVILIYNKCKKILVNEITIDRKHKI